MRLRKIRLSGFKSFVDPTTVHLRSNLVGVVGPNGSGKSNIIDAVRWVMGESSAKHLRGEAMADVVFNGSASRKPVSKASVELVFDNADGRLGGPYARYSEISVKRQVTRDGQSQYFLNGTRCRRRDITDLFLGTGLGPRSYAIIEQGMITRLIEARPEELRAIIEEAAGISRYKERRRETENRIRHTRENLSRLRDVQEEVEKQLEKLKRQARTAERYQALRQEARRLGAERLALEWRDLDRRLAEEQGDLERAQTALEGALAEQRRAETKAERLRLARDEATERFNAVQARYYDSGAQVATLEQEQRHVRERLAGLERERERAQADLERTLQRQTEESEALERLQAERDALAPRLETLRAQLEAGAERLEAAETDLREWQAARDGLRRQEAQAEGQVQVLRTRVEHLERRLADLSRQEAALREEQAALDPQAPQRERDELSSALAATKTAMEDLQRRLAGQDQTIARLRQENERLLHQAQELAHERQGLHGRHSALATLQAEAEGEEARHWLREHGLDQAPRLLDAVEVDPGWEAAVEACLGGLLQARRVRSLAPHLAELDASRGLDLALVQDAPPERGEAGLAENVVAPRAVLDRLRHIHPARDRTEALSRLSHLPPESSVITPDGTWLGHGWVRVARAGDPLRGSLQRSRELRRLEQALEAVEAKTRASETARREVQDELEREEARRRETRAALEDLRRRQAEDQARLSRLEERLQQLEQRRRRLDEALAESETQRQADESALATARARLEAALTELTAVQEGLARLEARGEGLQEAVETWRESQRARARELHQGELDWQRLVTRIEAAQQAQRQARERRAEQERRQAEVEQALAEARQPLERLERDLAAALAARAALEGELGRQRQALEAAEAALRQAEDDRHRLTGAVQASRQGLDERRLACEALKVRRDTVGERLAEQGQAIQELLPTLPDDADAQTWEGRLAEVEQAIARLGPINLAAIDEHRELSQRKAYLDSQRQDLEEALATLESAMRKIDRETRSRFRETFEAINAGLQGLFPRLFGGGQAHLELTGEDLLDTGVAIMARPPGKRIGNIHLLSGGEKALTAVALVFAIFQLNPAPFCMLDEVDAPLDEANVGRFSRLVQEMSQQVQFVFVTHNKATMEVAEQLHGVTMSEPGVSRLVSVDVLEAVALAAV